MNLSVTIGVSDENYGAENIYKAYKQARHALKYQLIYGSGIILEFNIIKLNRDDFLGFDKTKEEIFINNLRNCKVDEAKVVFKKLCSEVKQFRNVKYESVLKFFKNVVNSIMFVVEERRINKETKLNNIVRDRLIKLTWQFETIEEIEDWILDIIDKLDCSVLESEVADLSETINKIVKYVDNNYNKDINLNQISSEVFLSPSYISRMFKKETGYGFTQYLTKKRVQKSKELLLDPKCKISDVAKELSCGNVQNFIRMFKMYEGMTPGQYRGLHLKNITLFPDKNETG